jgi:hypothetical protein
VNGSGPGWRAADAWPRASGRATLDVCRRRDGLRRSERARMTMALATSVGLSTELPSNAPKTYRPVEVQPTTCVGAFYYKVGSDVVYAYERKAATIGLR